MLVTPSDNEWYAMIDVLEVKDVSIFVIYLCQKLNERFMLSIECLIDISYLCLIKVLFDEQFLFFI